MAWKSGALALALVPGRFSACASCCINTRTSTYTHKLKFLHARSSYALISFALFFHLNVITIRTHTANLTATYLTATNLTAAANYSTHGCDSLWRPRYNIYKIPTAYSLARTSTPTRASTPAPALYLSTFIITIDISTPQSLIPPPRLLS